MHHLVAEIHEDAKAKGWWGLFENGTVVTIPSEVVRMNIVAEIAEATEEVRNRRLPIYQWADESKIICYTPTSPEWDSSKKPEGEAVELADAVIRILDYYGAKGWQIAQHMNDHVGLYESDIPLVDHMQFVEFVAKARGADEEKNLGRVVVLIKDYFEKRGWDIEATMRIKMDFNKTRPFRHGNKAH